QGFFVQDDWKSSPRLTVNLGLRYDYEGAPTERYNRNLRGLDFVSPSPIEAAARAQYALSPIPEVSPDSFHVRGGPVFADAQHRSFWNAARANVQPRLGLAYTLNDRTVLRGGWAIFTGPIGIGGIFQTGYRQATNIIASRDTGRTFRADFANPFPDG